MKIWFVCSLKIMHSLWKYSQFVVVCNCLFRGVSGGLQILLWGPTSLGQRGAATTRHMCCLWRTRCLWNAAHATTALLFAASIQGSTTFIICNTWLGVVYCDSFLMCPGTSQLPFNCSWWLALQRQ
jgi:hypothetical protein